MSSLLGEIHFEQLPGKPGRVRCIETGHELLVSEKESYGHSKKCRRTLFDLCLAQRRAPLNVFEQSPNFKDKVLCKLTGDLLNKSEDAIWKHMNGKKFLRKLAQKEDEKKVRAQQCAEDFMDASEETSDNMHLGIDPTQENHVCSTEGDEGENMDSEEPEFWAPPSDDDKGSDLCEDRLLSSTDQKCENELRRDESATLTGIKRKTKKGPRRSGALNKKLRPDSMS